MSTEARALSRPWDAFDGYLFDIDGTLLNCTDAVHYFAFCDALSEVAGRPLNLDGVVCHGNVDLGILRDAFAVGGVEETTWRPRAEAICEAMGAQVERNRGELRIDVLDGVPEVLGHLRNQGAVLSTATGNLRRVGEAKLAACGLLRYFDLGGWSDACETRAEVFRRAVRQLRERVGEDASLCVFGDTPADITAARANGLEVIAVATGIHSLAVLKSEGPEVCLGSLRDLPGMG